MNDLLKNYISELLNERLPTKLEKFTLQIKQLYRENTSLKAKVNNLEDIVEKLCIKLNLNSNFATTQEDDIFDEKKDEIEETWLYWVKTGLTIEEIIQKLNFSHSAFSIDVQVHGWSEEKQVYHTILSNILKSEEFSDDWSGMNNKELQHHLKSILSANFRNDTVVVLRNLPERKNKNYDAIMSNLAMFVGFMFNAWEELEITQESIGRMGLILESEEKLEILNVINDDARLILMVEPLFEENDS